MALVSSKMSRHLIAFGIALTGIASQAEPLAEFDVVVARCQQAFSERPMTEVAYAQAAGSWVKRLYAPSSISFQVQKTNSSISPFVGRIEITEMAAARRGDDEETVRTLDVSMDENVLRTVRSIHFAYQGNGWVALGAKLVTEVKRDAAADFSMAATERLSREALMESRGPVSRCSGANRF